MNWDRTRAFRNAQLAIQSALHAFDKVISPGPQPVGQAQDLYEAWRRFVEGFRQPQLQGALHDLTTARECVERLINGLVTNGVLMDQIRDVCTMIITAQNTCKLT